MSKPAKPTLWSEDKPNVTTIIPELAEEIGLNESLVLRQIVFWINTSNNLRDGEWWTYQSLSEMKEKSFPYFSVSTLSRTINKLVEKGLLNKSNKYNKRKNDRTQWFSLNLEGVASLTSVTLVLQGEKASKPSNDNILHIEKTILQNEKRMLQNETTLPDYNPEYKQQKEEDARARKTSPSKEAVSDGSGIDKIEKMLDELQLFKGARYKDRQLFHSDFDDYSLEDWIAGVDVFKGEIARKVKEQGASYTPLPYKYLEQCVSGKGIARAQAEVMKRPKVIYTIDEPLKLPSAQVDVDDKAVG